ncbi:MAG: hypothetical protein IT210_15465 [Armatimonadetes bacterium]|nr:hypothetical protein [Armatimonadota bacterium]
MPAVQPVDDPPTWASGALRYDISLAPGERKRLDFAFHLHAGHPMLDWLEASDQPVNLDVRESDFLNR